MFRDENNPVFLFFSDSNRSVNMKREIFQNLGIYFLWFTSHDNHLSYRNY